MSPLTPEPTTAECTFESHGCGDSSGTLYIKVQERLIAVPMESRFKAHQLLGSDELRSILKEQGIENVDSFFWGDQGCCGF